MMEYLQQSISNGPCNRRCLLMAGAVVTTAVFMSVIVIVLVRVKGNECMQDLECLAISKCEGHIVPDFIYGCGSHDEPKICCIPKNNDTDFNKVFKMDELDNEMAIASRVAKMALLPKKCGIGDIEDKIANGENATLGMFPWMVILGYRSIKHPFIEKNCGGTIINDRYILTAAHCAHIDQLTLSVATLGELNLATAKDCEIYEGEPFCADDPVTIDVEKIIPHEKFNRTSLKNDIALLRLKHIIKFTEYIKPVCLPIKIKIDENYFLTKNFTISGWGTTSASSVGVSSILQHTKVHPWKTEKCNEALKVPYGPVEDRQVCATGTDFKEACRGDSGGPMTFTAVRGLDLRATQFGIVSFKSFDSCGTENVPTIFTRVDRYLDWILDNIEP